MLWFAGITSSPKTKTGYLVFAKILGFFPAQPLDCGPQASFRIDINQPLHGNDPASSLPQACVATVPPLQVDQLARVVPDLDHSHRVVVGDPCHIVCAQVVHLEIQSKDSLDL